MSDEGIDVVERVAVVEEILSVVRHDLRNRFGTIRNASFYLARKASGSSLWNDDPRVPKFFSMIADELGRADELLTNGARAIVRLERVRSTSEIRLRPFVESLGARYVGDEAIEVGADPDELRMAVRCLVRNALERPNAVAAPEVHVVTEGGRVRIDVRDDGPPLDDAAVSGALVAFSSTKPGHLGIGLNLVERFASRHGGTFELVSDEAGTLARMVIPTGEDAS